MSELIKVNYDSERATTSARTLWEGLDKIKYEVDGIKFYKKKTGYYESNKTIFSGFKILRLHIYIYEKYHNIIIPIGYDIHHKDENKLNNNIDNLIMLTKSEHHKLHSNHTGFFSGRTHSKETKDKLSMSNRGDKSIFAKLTKLDVRWIRYWLSQKCTQKEIAKAFNVSIGAIADINTKRTWKDI